jgi:hypothetical protein
MERVRIGNPSTKSLAACRNGYDTSILPCHAGAASVSMTAIVYTLYEVVVAKYGKPPP